MKKKEKKEDRLKSEKDNINNNLARKRLLVLTSFFIIFAMVVAGYTGYVQLLWAKELRVMASEMQNRDRTIKAQRGNIYDSLGNPLAISISVDTITASPAILGTNTNVTVAEVTKRLSEILDLDYDSLLKKLDNKTQYQQIAFKVEKELSQEVKEYLDEFKIDGIYIQKDTKRYYPYGDMCAHVIGFAGDDNQGLLGLELAADSYLRGIDGKILSDLDVKGTQLPFSEQGKIEATDGYNVVTTINIDIQKIAEEVVNMAIVDNKSQDGAVCIVSDSKSGKVLAMVSEPGFDLNDPRALPEGYNIEGWTGMRASDVDLLYSTVWRNKALMDTYEPGSTFKAITTAIALEESKITLDTLVTDFPVTVSGATIHCWSKEYPHGEETFLQAIYNSCNPVFVKISHLIGVDIFYDYIRNFGFRNSSGIELYGEGESIFHENPTKLDMSVASFGQRFQVTPMQMVSAYNAIANGGYLKKPYLIEKITDQNNNTIMEFEPTELRQVISKESSDQLREVLEGVVSEGGGKNAYVEGYKIAGKTGTSETTIDDVYVSSFIGFAPADNPAITVLFIVFNPQGESYYGSQVAAPYAKIVFQRALEELGVRQSSESKQKAKITIPSLTGYNIKKAAEKLKSLGLTYEIEGNVSKEDTTVMYQFPVSGDILSSDSHVVLYTYVPDSKKTIQMPYLIGKDKDYVIKTLRDLGLNVQDDGNGICVDVEYPAGSLVEKGTIVKITFRYTDYLD